MQFFICNYVIDKHFLEMKINSDFSKLSLLEIFLLEKYRNLNTPNLFDYFLI